MVAALSASDMRPENAWPMLRALCSLIAKPEPNVALGKAAQISSAVLCFHAMVFIKLLLLCLLLNKLAGRSLYGEV
jgi:hypothetical protein